MKKKREQKLKCSCGGEQELVMEHVYITNLGTLLKTCKGYRIICPSCGRETVFYITKSEAISAWEKEDACRTNK